MTNFVSPSDLEKEDLFTTADLLLFRDGKPD
jgi:hypothetical protein